MTANSTTSGYTIAGHSEIVIGDEAALVHGVEECLNGSPSRGSWKLEGAPSRRLVVGTSESKRDLFGIGDQSVRI